MRLERISAQVGPVDAAEPTTRVMHDNKEKTNAARQQAEGTVQQVAGRAKEAWGAVTNDTSDRVEGQADQVVGKAKEKIGELRRDIAED